jgi:CRP-like cAMP-binding protein
VQTSNREMERPDFKNMLLRSLSPDAAMRLELRETSLSAFREIESIGGEIRHVVFLEDGVASITTTFHNGLQAEVGMAGYESVLGSSVLLGARRSLNRVYMQNEGWGYLSPASAALKEFQRQGEFQRQVLRYTQAQLLQSMQTAGCNARHNVQQRLARWLLLCDDRLDSRPFLSSQAFISEMLGVRRTSVSVESCKFQEQGLISCSRGKIAVLDRPGLERKSCECYHVVRDHLQNYADREEGFGVSPFSGSFSAESRPASITAHG